MPVCYSYISIYNLRQAVKPDSSAKVATEALREDRTIQAIAAKYEVHPNQVSGWKRQAQAGLEEVFAGATRRPFTTCTPRSAN